MDKKSENSDVGSNYYQQQPFSSALQVFSSMGGLALLAQHLPTVYPEAVRNSPKEKSTLEQSDSEWIKVDGILNEKNERDYLNFFLQTVTISTKMWRRRRVLVHRQNLPV